MTVKCVCGRKQTTGVLPGEYSLLVTDRLDPDFRETECENIFRRCFVLVVLNLRFKQ
jgi:hypothetical protein